MRRFPFLHVGQGSRVLASFWACLSPSRPLASSWPISVSCALNSFEMSVITFSTVFITAFFFFFDSPLFFFLPGGLFFHNFLWGIFYKKTPNPKNYKKKKSKPL